MPILLITTHPTTSVKTNTKKRAALKSIQRSDTKAFLAEFQKGSHATVTNKQDNSPNIY